MIYQPIVDQGNTIKLIPGNLYGLINTNDFEQAWFNENAKDSPWMFVPNNSIVMFLKSELLKEHIYSGTYSKKIDALKIFLLFNNQIICNNLCMFDTGFRYYEL